MKAMVLLLGLVAGCVSPKVEATPLDRMTQVGRYRVALALDPDPPRLGELFRVSATVRYPDGRVIENAKVTVDARMPQHEHGMETRPRLRQGRCDGDSCVHEDGVYLFDGFKFHMVGDWTFLIDVEGPRGPDSTSMIYRMRG
jgi:hypothetical protein